MIGLKPTGCYGWSKEKEDQDFCKVSDSTTDNMKKRPIKTNLLRQLELARKDLAYYQMVAKEGVECAYQIKRAKAEVENLERLTK